MSFDFRQSALLPLTPIECWAIYTIGNDYHIERAKVDGKGRIMDYKPLGIAAARKIGRALAGQNDSKVGFSGNMTKVLLIHLEGDNMTAVWHRPPQKWKFHYTKDMDIPDGERWMPGLLFHVLMGNIYIWAYKEDEWDDRQTKVYYAPIHNIYSDGRLCINLKSKWITGDTWESWRNRIETQVFNTLKSEIHFGGYKTQEHDLTKLHRMLPDMKEFPEDWLSVNPKPFNKEKE